MDNKILNIKSQLKNECSGRVMVRKSKSFTSDYKVYFDLPTQKEKDTIYKILEENGVKHGNSRIVGGVYGYVINIYE